MPPSNKFWPGFPRYCLPRIRTASGTSIIHYSPNQAAEDVWRTPLSEALHIARQTQQMRARRLRIAKNRVAAPNLAIHNKSAPSDNQVTTNHRQVIFPRRSDIRGTDSSIGRASTTRGPRHEHNTRNRIGIRRAAPPSQRRSICSQRIRTSSNFAQVGSVRSRRIRRSSGHRPRTVRRTGQSSQASSIRVRQRHTSGSSRPPTVRRQGGSSLSRSSTSQIDCPPRIRVQPFRSQKTPPKPLHIPPPSPKPSLWGLIPSASSSVRKTPLQKQLFISRRVGGQFVHEPITIKQSSSDILHRGLSNSSRNGRLYSDLLSRSLSNASRKSRLYDKRLPLRGNSQRRPKASPVPFAIRTTASLLSTASFEYAGLDGSSAGRSTPSSQIMYADEESESAVNTPQSSPPRTDSEARALQSFTQGLQQHYRATYDQPIVDRTRSPSVAPTIGSAHTVQELLTFRAELQAAGLAVTSTDQKDPNRPRKRPSQRRYVPTSQQPGARKYSVAQPTHSHLAAPSGVELNSPRTRSPGNGPSSLSKQSNVLDINMEDSPSPPNPNKKSISMPREKPVPKKILPWLKKSGLKPGREIPATLLRGQLLADQHSILGSGRSSTTTIIDFSPHPSEFWRDQGHDFDAFQNRYPDLELHKTASPDRSTLDGGQASRPLREEPAASAGASAPQVPQVMILDDLGIDPGHIVVHQKIEPPRVARLELGRTGHRAPPSLQRQVSADYIDVRDLVRSDSAGTLPTGKLSQASIPFETIPDFSSFVTVSEYDKDDDDRKSSVDKASVRSLRRVKSAEERSPRRSFSSFAIEVEDDPRRARTRVPFDQQRTKFEIKTVIPWELSSESTRTQSAHKSAAPKIEHIPLTQSRGSEREPVEPQPKRLFSGKLAGFKSKLMNMVKSDSPVEEKDETEIKFLSPPPPLPEPKRIEPVFECEQCPNESSTKNPETGSILDEPKMMRSFQEWQAGVPFKPPTRLNPETNQQEEVLPCGHTKRTPSYRAGDPIKRNIAARRPKHPPSTRVPSIFTIQESVPPLNKTPLKSVMVSLEDKPDVNDAEVLRGLGIAMEAVLNEDVDAWINELSGTGVRRFLADLSAMDRLGTGALVDAARKKGSVRKRRIEMRQKEKLQIV